MMSMTQDSHTDRITQLTVTDAEEVMTTAVELHTNTGVWWRLCAGRATSWSRGVVSIYLFGTAAATNCMLTDNKGGGRCWATRDGQGVLTDLRALMASCVVVLELRKTKVVYIFEPSRIPTPSEPDNACD